MSNETTPQRLLATPVSTPELPALNLHEIQGDVLIGLQKNYERFIFFEIAEVAAFKSALRKHPPGTKQLHRPNRWSVFLRALYRGVGERAQCLACIPYKSLEISDRFRLWQPKLGSLRLARL